MAPAQKIYIIEHKTWQVSGFQIFKALYSTIINMLQEKLKMGIMEPYHGLY